MCTHTNTHTYIYINGVIMSASIVIKLSLTSAGSTNKSMNQKSDIFVDNKQQHDQQHKYHSSLRVIIVY